MFSSTLSVASILLAASMATAADIVARDDITICAICPATDVNGAPVFSFAGYVTYEGVAAKFCGYEDLGADGPHVRCTYDNSGVLLASVNEFGNPLDLCMDSAAVAAPEACEVY